MKRHKDIFIAVMAGLLIFAIDIAPLSPAKILLQFLVAVLGICFILYNKIK